MIGSIKTNLLIKFLLKKPKAYLRTMIKENSISMKYWRKFALTTFFILVSLSSYCEKKIQLGHIYTVKEQKLYNVDGAELYLITGTDTLFVPKIDRYEFVLTDIQDSISSRLKSAVSFMVKTANSIYFLSVDKEVWVKNAKFQFSFYRIPKFGSRSSVAFQDISAASPVIICPNKEWKRKFYPYKGQ